MKRASGNPKLKVVKSGRKNADTLCGNTFDTHLTQNSTAGKKDSQPTNRVESCQCSKMHPGRTHNCSVSQSYGAAAAVEAPQGHQERQIILPRQRDWTENSATLTPCKTLVGTEATTQRSEGEHTLPIVNQCVPQCAPDGKDTPGPLVPERPGVYVQSARLRRPLRRLHCRLVRPCLDRQ